MSDIHIPHKRGRPSINQRLAGNVCDGRPCVNRSNRVPVLWHAKSAIPPNAEIVAEAQISISTDQTGAVQVFNAHGEMLADWDGDKGGFGRALHVSLNVNA